MINLHNIFFTPTQSKKQNIFHEPSNRAPSICDLLKQKIDEVWKELNVIIYNNFNDPLTEIVQNIIEKLDKIEATEQKHIYCSALRKAWVDSMIALKKAQINPKNPPKQIAFQLTAILTRFGIAIYADKSVSDPFQSSLDVLKTALLMQYYALGLIHRCPDLSNLRIIDDLYNLPEVYEVIRPLADYGIDNLKPVTWSAKTFLLTEKQQINISELLRYINGSMRHLEQLTLPKSELLLQTAVACLKAAQTKKHYNQIEVNNCLAELKYNDISCLIAHQIIEFQTRGETQKAEEKKEDLKRLWEDCVLLSKTPDQMHARCENKRIFIEKQSLQVQMELSQSSLERHLALPRDQQDVVLIALSHYNLSYLYKEMNDIPNAAKQCKLAMESMVAAKNKGEYNVQFDLIMEHAPSFLSNSVSPNQ